jgi:hypothetical protein
VPTTTRPIACGANPVGHMDNLSLTEFTRAGRTFWTRPAAALPMLFLLGTFAAGTCQAQKYRVTSLLALPGGTYTSAAKMNNVGEVVGGADDASGDSVAVAWNGPAPSIVYMVNPLFFEGGVRGCGCHQ